jgi:hypothetical protein
MLLYLLLVVLLKHLICGIGILATPLTVARDGLSTWQAKLATPLSDSTTQHLLLN